MKREALLSILLLFAARKHDVQMSSFEDYAMKQLNNSLMHLVS